MSSWPTSAELLGKGLPLSANLLVRSFLVGACFLASFWGYGYSFQLSYKLLVGKNVGEIGVEHC